MKKIFFPGFRLPAFFLLLMTSFLSVVKAQTATFSTAGTGTWTAPCDVTSITVEVWGAGGGGGSVQGSPSTGGGGAGGGYVKTVYSVTAGTVYNYSVGGGGASGTDGLPSWFSSQSEVLAVGGKSALTLTSNNAWGAGAIAVKTGNVGGNLFSTYGGDGGSAASTYSGGGGSSGGNANGNNASGSTAGQAPTSGFAGAAGTLTAGSNGIGGGTGAGGSGGFANSRTNMVGGNGGTGLIKITYSSVFKPYCTKSFNTVEPITNVTFAEINNTTSATVNGTPVHENFCMAANVVQGASYLISLQGNTNGNSTDFFRVYIDWDQNGTFGNNTNEIYDIGSITNSAGINAVLSKTIVVPPDALPGSTRMRVVKNYNTYTDACTTATYGQSEGYTVIVAAEIPCTGTPVGGTALASPTSGLPSSTFNAYVTGATGAGGLAYQWESSALAAGPWTNIPGATSSVATIQAPGTADITYYRRKITCIASGLSAWSDVASYTAQYCSPGVSAGNESINYITNVKFLGTLQDTSQNSTYSSNPAGYQDWTGNAVKSSQAQGNGINLYVENKSLAVCKAWVDWNRDGDFDDAGEAVYTSGGTSIISTTFGFTIPVSAVPGDYTVRIRINNQGGSTTYTSCGIISNAGETEDYRFTVISNCTATINAVSEGSICGEGSVAVSATASAGSTELRWYDSISASVPIATSPTVGGTATLWSTPSVSGTTVFYVTAFNGSCESLVRTPVKAIINPVPVIEFTPTAPTTCGSNSTVRISASGQNQTDYFINEKFGSGLGVFTNVNYVTTNGATIDSKTVWQNRTSTFQPKEQVWFPAISSGINGNKFVMSTSDVGSYTIDNALLSPLVDSGAYISMTLKFRMYYSRYIADNDPSTSDYVDIDVSKDGGANWTTIERLMADVGYGTSFAQKEYDVSAFVSTNFKFRINYHGVFRDGVAIDDVELYGVRPLSTKFTWTSSAPINVFSDPAATIPLISGTTATTVYMKPSAAQTELTASWDIAASASLSNGCSASGQVTITNKNKVWNISSTDWNTAVWKPAAGLPTLNDCVDVKTPLILSAGIGYAKEVYVEPGGTLNIRKDASLKVQDGFTNGTTAAAVVIESDGGLIQVNEGNTINTGAITAQRLLNLSAGRQQYNYMVSPLEGQSLKTVYPGINYVLYHNEANNYFYSSSGAYIKGRGLAVKEPNTTGVPAVNTTTTANFTGYPTNGAFTYNLVNSAPAATISSNTARGFNLIGNPYPSNIDLILLYLINGGSGGTLSPTFYLWDSTVNDIYVQQGDKYGAQSYGQFNAVAATGLSATGDINMVSLKLPTNIVKMGQAFMARSITATTALKFNNTIRTSATDGKSYFGKNIPEHTIDRYWLKLVSPSGIEATCAVVYFAGGDNGLGNDDSYSMGGSDAVYSLVGQDKVSINGRSSFAVKDVIALGTAHFTSGKYTLGIEAKEGIFESAQDIYLKDKQTGMITNISEGSYTFAANAGESTGRFEIIYNPETVLATNAATKEELQIYRDGSDFVIKAQTKKITGLQVYDASGKLILSLKPNSINAVIDAAALLNGMYFIQINQSGEVTTRKVLK